MAGIVADLFRDGEVIEVQTGSVTPLVKKLLGLPPMPVTIVLPIIREKRICTVDENGVLLRCRKSPKRGTVYDCYYQLPRLLPLLGREKLTLRLLLLDADELPHRGSERPGRPPGLPAAGPGAHRLPGGPQLPLPGGPWRAAAAGAARSLHPGDALAGHRPQSPGGERRPCGAAEVRGGGALRQGGPGLPLPPGGVRRWPLTGCRRRCWRCLHGWRRPARRAGWWAAVSGTVCSGGPVHDYDIAVSCPPARTAALFSGHELVLAGAAHGTVGVVAGGRLLELTTFRADGAYRDRRHPEQVAFLPDIDGGPGPPGLYGERHGDGPPGRLRDPYGGRKDLEARLLRAVGEPERRFSEDALRILRLARFAAKLGFSVEGETLAAALRLRRETAALSAERITAEVAGFVDGEYFSRAAGEMLGLFAGVWPALAEVPSEMLAAFARAEEPDSRLLFDGPGGLTGGTGRRRWRPSAGGCGCPGAGSGCWTRQPGGWPSRRRRTLPRSGGGPAVSVTKPPAWPLPWTGRWAAPGSRRPPSMSGGGSAGQGCPGASGSWR